MLSKQHKSLLALCLFCLLTQASSGQRQVFLTDSNQITITKYGPRIEEMKVVYFFKDSIWTSKRVNDDGRKTLEEGWTKRNGQKIGIWTECIQDGEILNMTDYDQGTCEVNPKFYPNHVLLENMKQKADEFIRENYSPEFFEKHVRFTGDCHLYHLDAGEMAEQMFYIFEPKVGTWTEPFTQIPNAYIFYYDIRFDSNFVAPGWIRVALDSAGNRRSEWDIAHCLEPEDYKQIGHITFAVEKIHRSMGALHDSLCVNTYSKHIESFQIERDVDYPDGSFSAPSFTYHFAVKTGEHQKISYSDNRNHLFTIEEYDDYIFDPWSGEFIRKQKMYNRKKMEVLKTFGIDLGRYDFLENQWNLIED